MKLLTFLPFTTTLSRELSLKLSKQKFRLKVMLVSVTINPQMLPLQISFYFEQDRFPAFFNSSMSKCATDLYPFSRAVAPIT